MSTLNAAAMRAYDDFLRQLYSHTDLRSFPQFVAALLPSVLDIDLCGISEIDYTTNAFQAAREPVIDPQEQASLSETFIAHMGDHPLAAAPEQVLSGATVLLSQSLGRTRWRNSPLFREFYQRVGVQDELGTALPVGGGKVLCFFTWRSGSYFNSKDFALLQRLHTHLLQAHRNAKSASLMINGAELLDDLDGALQRCFVWLQADGRVQHWSERCFKLALDYFPGSPLEVHRLPEPLERWIQLVLSKGGSSTARAREGYCIDGPNGRLKIRLLNRKNSTDFLMVFDEQKTLNGPRLLPELGLTARESQVLWWVAQGKTNPEIAVILEANVLTIKKHLENILGKLGVETRTAAALLANEVYRH